MDLAHSASDTHEHALRFVDLYTHADEIRGYVRFDTWGAWIEDGRVLRPASAALAADSDGSDGETPLGDPAELVELTLGPTVHDRVRFTPDPEEL